MCKMKKQLIFLAVSFVLLAFVQSAAASENQTNDETETVVQETMVVTSSRILEKKQNVSTNVTVYGPEELEVLSADDLSDVLAKEGLLIREYPNSTISVYARGFNTETHGNDLSSSVLILIDGRRSGTGNLAKISMDNVERVEIIRGPGSVQYGASAMGAVINVITKRGSNGVHGSVEGTLGSWDYKKGQVDLSGDVANFDFSVSASKASQGDYDTGDGLHYYNTGYDSKDKFDITAGYTFMPKNRIGFSFSDYEGNQIGGPDYLSDNDLEGCIEHALRSADMFYDGQAMDGFLLWSLRYFQGKDEYETYDAPGEEASYFRNTEHKGAQAQVTAKWDFLNLTGGFDWTSYSIVNTNTDEGKDNTYDNPAFFLLAKTFLLDDKLILSLGGRYDEYEVEGDDGRSKENDNWSKSVGAVYKLPAGFSVRANYAEAFKMPTAEQLYMYTDYSAWGFGIWSGNEDLDPESSKTYEMGIDYIKNSVTVGLTGFHTKYKNKISYSYNSDLGVTQYENVEGATFEGFEGNMQFDMGAMLGWNTELIPYGSITYMTKYEDDATGEDLSYVQHWNASWGLKLNNEALEFTSCLTFTYYGKHDITDYEGTGETRLGGDTIVDISFSKVLCAFEKSGKMSLKGEITNLFNRDYAMVQGYTAPGRTMYMGLNYSF